MAFSHDEERVRAERARAIGLFRYSLISEAADAKLSTRQRGRLVRAIAEREHEGPFGQPVRVSRATLDRWLRDWRRGGFDALVPTPPKVSPRTPADVLDLAVALKKEVPERTAVQVAAILRAHSGWSPDERTLQRHFVRLELNTRPDGLPPQAFGRFEADAPNQRWTGDALHGPTVAGRKAILFAFIDDHCRAADRVSVGPPRGHRATGGRAAQRPGRPRHPGLALPGQRLSDDRQAAAAGLRVPGHPHRPLPARAAGRAGEDREVLPHRARTVPRRDRLRPRTGRHDPAEHAVHRVGRDGLPPPRALRDRADADRAVVGDHPADAVDRAAARGVPLVGVANRHEDRHGRAARQQVRGRRRPGRPQGRARVRPVRPDPHRGPLARPLDGAGGAARHRPARARQGPPRRHGATGAGANRDRLPAPGRAPAHRRTGRTGPVRPTARRAPAGRARRARPGQLPLPGTGTTTRRRRRARCRRDREAEVALRVHQDPVRARRWRRRCCTATAPTPKRSPASTGASANAASASSPARSAPARPWPSAPPSPGWTPPGTR